MSKFITFNGGGLSAEQEERLEAFIDEHVFDVVWRQAFYALHPKAFEHGVEPSWVAGKTSPDWYSGAGYPAPAAKRALLEWWLELVLKEQIVGVERKRDARRAADAVKGF